MIQTLKFKTGGEWLKHIAETDTTDTDDEQFIKYISIQIGIPINIVCGIVYILPTPSQPISIQQFAKMILKTTRSEQ